MPQLARMIGAPVVVDVRPGALADLGRILSDQRISTSGRVAIAAGSHTGPAVRDVMAPQLGNADWYTVGGGSVDAALELAEKAKPGRYDAIVGVGGGRVLDVTKYAAARLGLSMVAVATNLAHDGIASPVSTLDNDAGRGSYGVPAPLAIVVDLDVVRLAPARSVRAGIGEVLSNLSALADWELSAATTGEAYDGLAAGFGRTAAEAVLHHPGGTDDDAFLRVLAEALVLSGLAITIAGTSRPASGACHEISHAIDLWYPERAGQHGEQVGVGAVFASTLRGDHRTAGLIDAALRRHGLPTRPADLGFGIDEFADLVGRAPETRPGRYTILEHLDLPAPARLEAVRQWAVPSEE